jgi:hypothetical protein
MILNCKIFFPSSDNFSKQLIYDVEHVSIRLNKFSYVINLDDKKYSHLYIEA